MPNPSEPAARVYAAALVEVGHEQGALGAIYDDVQAVARMYAEDRWFREFFTSPRIDREVKWNAVREAFAGQVNRPTMGLLKVLIEKGRESLLDNIADQFGRFRDQHENRIHAHVTVAQAMDADALDALRLRLETASGKSVELHQDVDPDALGGASLRVGDRVIDRTLRTKLKALRQQMLASADEGGR